MRQDAGQPGAVQQGLGGDATDVDADAAELLLLNHGGGESQLRGANGARIAGGAAAKDDHVELSHSILSRESSVVSRE